MIFRNIEVRAEPPSTPVRGHFTPKMNIYNLFYQKLDAENSVFQENREKLFRGRI